MWFYRHRLLPSLNVMHQDDEDGQTVKVKTQTWIHPPLYFAA